MFINNFFFAFIHDERKQKPADTIALLAIVQCTTLIFLFINTNGCVYLTRTLLFQAKNTHQKHQQKWRHSHTRTKQSYRVYRLIKSFALKSVARKSEAHFQSNYSIDSLMFCFVNNNFCTLLLWVNILKGNASLNTVWFFFWLKCSNTHIQRKKKVSTVV